MRIPITKDAKISAITCYFTFIGFIIAFFINFEKRNKFANFHLRQSLGIQTLFYATGALLGIAPSIYAGYGFFIFFFIIWTFSISTAFMNQMRPLPVLGNLFQKVFKFLK